MDKVIVNLLFIFLANLCQGQTPNFFADGSRWVYHNYETYEPDMNVLHSSDEQIVIHGDTVIGGITYFKLYTTFHLAVELLYQHQTLYSYDSVGPTFLRYDTLSKRVYHLPDVNSMERVIYDFSLQVGDTVPLQMIDEWGITVIDSIDIITVFGVSAKRFFLDFGIEDYEWRNFIIEGIGGSNGLLHFQPEYAYLGGGFYMSHFNCFQYGDSIFSPENLECPFIDFISAVDPISENHSLTISPNPTQGLFTVSISEELLNATCTIVDCLGRVTHTFKLTELNTTAQLSSPGFYFWRVEHDGHVIQTGKLICE